MEGEDNEMNKRMSLARIQKMWTSKVNTSFGFNYVNSNEFFKNHRLAFEFIIPVYQKVRGIQMADEYKIMLGWQYGFNIP